MLIQIAAANGRTEAARILKRPRSVDAQVVAAAAGAVYAGEADPVQKDREGEDEETAGDEPTGPRSRVSSPPR